MNEKYYAIADINGHLYAHDIESYDKATFMLHDTIKSLKEDIGINKVEELELEIIEQ